MHDLETKKNSGAAQPDHLLDELTSIKDLLAGKQVAGEQVSGGQSTPAQPAGAIPLLDDLVVSLPASPSLLDIERIFNEDAATPLSTCIEAPPATSFQFPKFTLDVAISDEPANSTSAAPAIDSAAHNLRANYRREALIQELIAEFAPQIEAALRERLERLDHTALQALKSQS